MKKVSIPEPCHENWADFTPTQKGAFCGTCQTDVVDFSNKTPFEVKSILAENAGKHMCGRFKKSQLDELNHDYTEWTGQSATTFRSKFLYACIIVFGMTLFTGCSIQESSLVQEIFSNNTELNLTSLSVGNDPVDPDSLKTETRHLKGKVAYTPPAQEKPSECTIVPDSNAVEEIFTKGDIAYDPKEFLLGDTIYIPEEKTLKGNLIEEDSNAQAQKIDTLFDDSMIDGLIKMPPIHEDSTLNEVKPEPIYDDEMIEGFIYTEPTEPIAPTLKEVMIEPRSIEIEEDTAKSILLNNPPLYVPKFAAKVFPNPTVYKTTIEIEVTEKAHYNIYLYAIDGKKVKTLFNGLYYPGVQRIMLDLKPYEAGSYLIVINGGTQKESFKLEKVE